jgi:hypothetical protein
VSWWCCLQTAVLEPLRVLVALLFVVAILQIAEAGALVVLW